jgi:hypothetical protein
MMLGEAAPPVGAVETLTASPFGFQLLGGELPLFDPYGWNPDLGLDQAIELLGYRCRGTTHKTAADALAGLESALAAGPVLVGPVDMGLLAHQPGSDRAAGADHFVVALASGEGSIRFHDPQGHPHAVLPTEVFLDAWRAEQIGYLAEDAFVMRNRLRTGQLHLHARSAQCVTGPREELGLESRRAAGPARHARWPRGL